MQQVVLLRDGRGALTITGDSVRRSMRIRFGRLQEELVEQQLYVEGSSRRRFVEWFLGTTLGAVALSVLYPVFRFVIPPEVAESTTNRVLAGTLAQMPSNSGKVFRFGSKPALLIRLPNGDFRAFTAICTHLGCTVEYRPDLQQIWCPCHNGFYNVQGVNVAGPPPRPLEEYTVAVTDDKIWVSRGA